MADKDIQKIAKEAIDSINKLTEILQNQNVTTTSRSSAVSELQQRFPTYGSAALRSGSTSSTLTATPRYQTSRRSLRYRPYQTSSSVGRPVKSSFVTRDVIIIEKEHDRVPTKSEKLHLERKQRVVSGFDVDRSWNAEQLNKQLASLLQGTDMEDLKFEIVKNCGGTLVTPNIPAGKQIDANLLFKSISPSGHIFIRLLDDLPHVTKEIEDMLSKSVFDKDSSSDQDSDIVEIKDTDTPSSTIKGQSTTSANKCYESPAINCPFDVDVIVSSAKSQNLIEPVEVVRFLQEKIVIGRKLDITSCSESCEGEVNYINVDRERPLETTFSELEFISDYRVTSKVGFTGEEVVDLGGPRREWIRIMNKEMKKKYFDNGLRQYLSQEYFYVGVMIAIAILQNGQMPSFIKEEILNEIVSSQSSNPCIVQIQAGLEQLGIYSALKGLPMLHYLLRPNSQHRISVPKLLNLLKPTFSEDGSNTLRFEKEVYNLFVRYLREVESGRRSCGELKLQLSNILEFVTASAEEPVLGFSLNPSIEFVYPQLELASSCSSSEHGDVPVQDKEVKAGFTPTAHTCGNILSLPMATIHIPLPSQERLFQIYDMAFSQSYFGKM